jgi:4-amino-4-deoxy-L-arabinose transferase-like glycosyltransferase
MNDVNGFQRSGAREGLYILLLICFVFGLFFFRLGGVGLFEPDEGRYSELAREMIDSGDYVVPRLNGVLYFEKPPLVYWATALCFRLFGYNEFAARFPVAFFGALGVVVTFFLAARMYGRKCAFYSSLVLLTGIEYFFVGRILILDMPLAFFITLCFASFYFYLYSGKNRGLSLMTLYASFALGLLTKGLIALVLPAGIFFVFLVLSGNFKRFLLDKRHIAGAFLFLLISVPWFWLIISREPSFFNFFFIREHFVRFLTKTHGRSKPMYYFLLILLVGFIPWISYLPFALRKYFSFRNLKEKKEQGFLFLVLWASGIFVFFSLSGSKLPAYIVPLYPALAIMVGRIMADASFNRSGSSKDMKILFVVLSVLFIAFAVFLAGAAFIRHRLWQIAPYIFVIITAVIAGLASSVFFMFRKDRKDISYLAQIAAVVIIQVAVVLALGRAEDYLSSKKIMTALSTARKTGDTVYSLGCYEQSMPFYLKERVRIIDWTGELEFGISKLSKEERGYWFIEGREKGSYQYIIDELASGKRLFIVIRKGEFEDFSRRNPEIKLNIIAETQETALVSNVAL